MGNGPFRMDGVWRRGSGIQVRRFDGFPGARPKVAGVEFRIYKRLSTAYTQVLSGDLDVVTAIPAERALTAADDLSGRLYRAPGSVVQLLAFPVVEHDFSDARVRRAISMAIDRDAMVGASSGPEHEPARSFVAPVVPGHRPQGCGEACRYDPTAARRLYAAAGGPAQLQIAYNADGRHQPWVDALCAQLTANLGVRCAGVTQPTFGGLLAAVQTHALTCPFRLSWEMAYPSMESYLGPLYTSTGAANYPGYRNADFDDLIRQAAAARSPAESIRRYQQAEDLLAADMPAIPLRFSRTMVGYSAAVRDVRTDRAGRVDLVAIDRTR